MDLDTTRDDIRFLREVSEKGRLAPLVGGRYHVLWGILMAIAYLFQFLLLSRILDWPGWTLLAMWVLVMAAGFIAMAIFGQQMKNKPGNSALGNRLEAAVWMSVGFSISAFSFGTFIATGFANAPVWLFDIIVVVAFAGYASSFLIVAIIADIRWMRIPAGIAYAATGILPFFVGKPSLYLISAGVIVLVAIIPGLISIRSEPPSLDPESPTDGEVA